VNEDDGWRSEQITLNHPSLGIYLPPLVWAEEFKHEPGSALMVFASRPYEPEDYMRGYEEFLSLVKGNCPHRLTSARTPRASTTTTRRTPWTRPGAGSC
jgi:hypothetical protein